MLHKPLNIEIESDNLDIIERWIYSQLKSYPQVNDKISYKEYEFIILKCDSKRVKKILILESE
jgi:CBS domain containing-hemolysin-like protein